MDEIKSVRNSLLIILAVLAFTIFKQLSSLMIPLILAALLTLLNLPLIETLLRFRIPRIFILPLVAGLTLVVLALIVTLFSGTFQNLMAEQDFLARQLSNKFDTFIIWIGDHVPWVDIKVLRKEALSLVSPQRIASVLGSLAGSVGSFGTSTLLFLLYYILLLAGAGNYHRYIKHVTRGDSRTLELWEETQRSISTYVGIKTLTSSVTGVLAGLICWGFQLPFALFWGFTTFLLNYIPSIGSIVATVLPLIVAFVYFNSFGYILGLTLSLFGIQILIGNIIDPILMGNRLRLNTVTVIFGLLFWGYIWGIPGMLLSVPLMVMIRLILERTADFHVLARVMGFPERSKKRNLKAKIQFRFKTRNSHAEKSKNQH